VRNADVIMSLDWVDLAGALKATFGDTAPPAKVIVVSSDFRIHNGWSMDYQGLPPADVLLPVTPEEAVPDLLEALGGGKPKPAVVKKAEIPLLGPTSSSVRALDRDRRTRYHARAYRCRGTTWPFRHPLDYVGSEGGGGVGGGPGNAVGTALALKGSGRLVIGVCGDS
jgi:hypothetical protein